MDKLRIENFIFILMTEILETSQNEKNKGINSRKNVNCVLPQLNSKLIEKNEVKKIFVHDFIGGDCNIFDFTDIFIGKRNAKDEKKKKPTNRSLMLENAHKGN